jgi:biopolymer transport protein ExbB
MNLFLWAQEEGGEGTEPEKKEKETILSLIAKSGLVGYLIILMSVAALALAIEHIITLRRDKLCPPDVVGDLEALFDEENYEEALTVCESRPSILSSIMAAGIARLGDGYEDMRKAMEEATEDEAMRLHQKISYLSLIGNIAPMMGLLGTVMGMIESFQVIATTPNPSPSQLADGIYKALVTTCEGLIVAIPVLAVYFYFRNRVNRLLTDTNSVAEELTERFKPVPGE